ncbi:MAG: ribbon-helix-helix protein, CopG family [Bifidobacteriaceae bacterium]|jgi:metal-responsive CopG/Arc/MetJ family transcriptional regulator|nr:ribbon-helix-helix protein, CopG family [Bifidobacteriaceae bacterium]
MAKVMVSLPDDVLAAIDAEAARRRATRSRLLRELAEDSMRRRSLRRAERVSEIRRSSGGPGGHGGQVSEALRADRLGH